MMKKLRLGLLIDSLEIPAWAYRALEQIAQSDAAETFLLILVEHPLENRTGKASARKSRLVYNLLDRLDEKIFVRSARAREKKDIRQIFPGTTTFSARSRLNGNATEIETTDIEKIREHNLDLIIQLGSKAFHGEIYTAAKYGVWSFAFSDEETVQGRPAGYWEVVESIPETGIVLKATQGHPEHTRALNCSYYFTYPFSPARNRNAIYWAAATILSRQVEALYQLGEEDYFAGKGILCQEGSEPKPRNYGFPSNLSALRHYLSVYSNFIDDRLRRLFYLPTWYLMFTLNGGPEIDLNAFKPIFPPRDRFWADPHVIFQSGKFYIFVEELLYKTGKGRISVIEMDSDGNCKGPACVLEEKYHLSYPFVFEWQGTYFMVPESAQNRSIDLYECVNFPYQWKFRMHLMENVRAVDTTLFYDSGNWWLFTALTENEDFIMPSELFLYYSKDLFTTNWTPHPCNPIISDIKKARPAGGLFRQDGRIYRPSQYNAKTYGYGIDLNEVQLLSETGYEEKEVSSLRPEGDHQVQAMHTFSKVDRLSMIDAFTQRRR